MTPDLAAQMLWKAILPRVSVIEFSIAEIMDALRVAQSWGVCGDGVYDYMHLLAAKKGNASVINTLNMDDFRHLRRGGDPEIRLP